MPLLTFSFSHHQAPKKQCERYFATLCVCALLNLLDCTLNYYIYKRWLLHLMHLLCILLKSTLLDRRVKYYWENWIREVTAPNFRWHSSTPIRGKNHLPKLKKKFSLIFWHFLFTPVTWTTRDDKILFSNKRAVSLKHDTSDRSLGTEKHI